MVEENKKMGKFPDMKCRIESAFHFPQASGGVDIQQTRTTESLASSFDSTMSTPPNIGMYESGQEMVSNDASFSFAKMLKKGPAKPSSYAPSTATKSAATILGSVAPKPRKNEDSEPEPEDYVPPPPKTSLGDALAQAFEQAKTGSKSADSQPDVGINTGTKSSKKGKKMKGQKIALTGHARPVKDYW